MHTDSVGVRKIAFTFHLTENWNIAYGGLLVHMDTAGRVTHVLKPEYNTLSFFDVSMTRFEMPHLVTEVAVGTPFPRVALTGWYSDTLNFDETDPHSPGYYY